MESTLRATSLAPVAIVLFLLLLAATHLGRIIARRQRKAIEDKDSSALATGMLGIFALLSAFSPY